MPRARARRSSRSPCARRTPDGVRGQTAPTPPRTRPPLQLQQMAAGVELPDPVGSDSVADEPVGPSTPVISVVLDARLQRYHVCARRPRHIKIARSNL